MKIILPSSLMICFSAILFFVLVPKQQNDFSKLWKQSGLDFSNTQFDINSQRAIASFDDYRFEFYKKANKLSGYDIKVDAHANLSDIKLPVKDDFTATLNADGTLCLLAIRKKSATLYQ